MEPAHELCNGKEEIGANTAEISQNNPVLSSYHGAYKAKAGSSPDRATGEQCRNEQQGPSLAQAGYKTETQNLSTLGWAGLGWTSPFGWWISGHSQQLSVCFPRSLSCLQFLIPASLTDLFSCCRGRVRLSLCHKACQSLLILCPPGILL